MEFPELGKNCSWMPCKALDFLPLTCSHCKLVFCKNHINADKHECGGVGQEKNEPAMLKTFPCSHEGCSSFSAVEMKCPKCQNNFCLGHRHHGCFDPAKEALAAKKAVLDRSKQRYYESLQQVHKIVNDGIKKSMLNPKKQEAACRINLMRLKAKAEGPKTIPAENRVYFSVAYKKNMANTQFGKAIFTSKDWSVGRVVDSVSDICNIPNKNNIPNEKKLRLFKKSDGSQISTDMAVKINDLISQNKIINGDFLILEYVDPSERLSEYKLLNYEDYKDT